MSSQSSIHNFKRKQISPMEVPIIKEKYSKMKDCLDEFIQNCLNKYKCYDISHSSEINSSESIYESSSLLPDLIIYNKTFNKNECFYGMKCNEFQSFPRVKFEIKREFNRKRSDKLFDDTKFKKIVNNHEEDEIFDNIFENLDKDDEFEKVSKLINLDSLFGYKDMEDNVNNGQKDSELLLEKDDHSYKYNLIDEEAIKKAFTIKTKESFNSFPLHSNDSDSSSSSGFDYSLFSDLSLFSKKKINGKGIQTDLSSFENTLTEKDNHFTINMIKKNLNLKNWVISNEGIIYGNLNSIELLNHLETINELSNLSILESETKALFNAQNLKNSIKETIKDLRITDDFLKTKGLNLKQNENLKNIHSNFKELGSFKNSFLNPKINELIFNYNITPFKGLQEDNPFFYANFYFYCQIMKNSPSNCKTFQINYSNTQSPFMNLNRNCVRNELMNINSFNGGSEINYKENGETDLFKNHYY